VQFVAPLAAENVPGAQLSKTAPLSVQNEPGSAGQGRREGEGLAEGEAKGVGWGESDASATEMTVRARAQNICLLIAPAPRCDPQLLS
jgi:hypothetical protein